MKLNERQRRFADEYIISGVAYNAAIKAGYSEKYAKTNSHKLRENTRIRAYIDERLDKLKTEKVADQQEILEFLSSVLRGREAESFPLGMGMGEQSLVKKELDGGDRIKAAELLGKRYAMWTDKQQVEDVTPTFVNDVPLDD